MRNGDIKCQYSTDDHRNDNSLNQKNDLSFVEQLKFDDKMKFLVGFGRASFFLLNLSQFEPRKITIREINTTAYERILDLSFTNSFDDAFFSSIHLACKKVKMNQICVFEYHLAENQQDEG